VRTKKIAHTGETPALLESKKSIYVLVLAI